MNNDNNNQSGNSRTTFNAYNEQKNSAKNAMLGKGLDVASKFVPGGAVAKKAINTVAKNPMANAALQNAISRNKASEDTEGEEPKSSPVNDLARAGVDTAKGAAKSAIKKKIFMIIAPYILPALGIFAILLVVVTLAAYAYQEINQVADVAIGSYESTLNFITGNGLKDNYGAAMDNINDASNTFSGLDKGILIATVNDSIFVPTTLYDEDYVEDEPVGDSGTFDAVKNFIANKYSIHSFYNMKRDMLGKSTGDAGSMLNSIIGSKISVECVTNAEYSELKSKKALLEYAYQGLLSANNVVATEITDNLENGFRTIWFGSIELNYKNQGSDFVWKEESEAINFIDNLPGDAIRKDWAELKAEAAKCSTQYAKDANGNPITSKPLKAQYTSSTLVNDYEKYYNYIRKVYVPVIYMSTWNSLSDEAKTKLVNEVWGDIVRTRNDYYAVRGEGNTLTYEFNEDGEIETYVNYTAGSSSSYYSNLTLSAARSEASSWKQGDSRWGNFYIGVGNRTSGARCNTRTMQCIGCLVTSISILMANSGTQINSNTFDPGILAAEIKNNNGFSTDGSLMSHNWRNLVPYFHFHKWESTSGMAKASISDKIISYLLDGYQVVVNVNSGGHFVAVTGVENGRILIGDPGWGNTPYYFDDNSMYPEGTINGLSIYVADDVRGR